MLAFDINNNFYVVMTGNYMQQKFRHDLVLQDWIGRNKTTSLNQNGIMMGNQLLKKIQDFLKLGINSRK